YPQNIKIPANFTIPAGNDFKFHLYLAGFVWYMCNTSSSDKWKTDGQYRVLSAIPEHDTSSILVKVINVAPSPDPTKNFRSEL
ncbi:12637_t:CDS:2, partial [Cetraspora pellucida]